MTFRSARLLTPVALTALVVCLSPVAAHATATGTWGGWSETANSGVPALDGTSVLSFPGAGAVQAGWTFDGWNGYASIQTTDVNNEYFTSDTPIGAVFGTNGPSADTSYLKITADSTDIPVLVTITFATPVPADTLGFAISDLDSDFVTVSATNADGVQLGDDALRGSAGATLADLAFNFCQVATAPLTCEGDTAAPVVTSDGLGLVTATGSESGTEGATAWFQPSEAVKSLEIALTNVDDEGPSNVRLWVAQLPAAAETPVPVPSTTPVTAEGTLAATGANTTALPWGIGALVAGAAALVLVRRRNAAKQ